MSIAKETGAIPFDTPGAELHHFVDNGYEYVSFDAIIKKYNLTDRALLDLAKIVRTADSTPHDAVAEGAGLEAAALGFREIAKDDYENMRLQFPLYDALYAYCKKNIKDGEQLEHSR